jgi:hypothetical protein
MTIDRFQQRLKYPFVYSKIPAEFPEAPASLVLFVRISEL